ncbi:MAG: MFS transporter [Clostridium sartagoforme]|nr:MFS transporter [Clostridium sartagoforme]
MKDNKYKNFIYFWLSQSVSQLGSSMTSYALIIWAYNQSNSVMSVSLMTFFSYIPYIIVSIFAGTFVDNTSKKKIMLYSDTIAAICSLFVLILLILGKLQLWHIYIINSITGFMNAFQSPASTVTIGIIVPKEMYTKASGMNSFTNSLLTLVTPMSAAFILSILGLPGVIIIDLLTFIFAFVILLFFVDIKEELNINIEKKKSIFHGFKEGLKFLINNKGILYMIISMAFLNFFSRLTYENILSPMILARSNGNNNTLAIVSGTIGLGGILGGLIVSFAKLPKSNLKLIYFSAAISFLFGDILMGLGQNSYIWCIAAVAASLPIPCIGAGINTIMYNKVPREIQGRIFAVRNAIQFCAIPIGILLGGFLADYVFQPFMLSNNEISLFLQKLVGYSDGSGMAVMFLLTGVLGFLASIFWYLNKSIRALENN